MMDKWTHETEQALEEYLAEVERLALRKGDDAAEIVSGLREHIIREAEGAAGEVVTLEHVRKVLAAVGTPEMVIGVDEATAREERPAFVPGTRRREATADNNRARKFMFLGVGCLAWTIGLGIVGMVVSVLLAFLSYVALEVDPAIRQDLAQEALEQESKAQIRAVLTTIFDVQEQFRAERVMDRDGDGVADYGTLEDLHTFAPHIIVDSMAEDGSLENYYYEVVPTDSGKGGNPHFLCKVRPKFAKSLYLTATATEKQEIHFLRDKSKEKYDTPDISHPLVEYNPDGSIRFQYLGKDQ